MPEGSRYATTFGDIRNNRWLTGVPVLRQDMPQAKRTYEISGLNIFRTDDSDNDDEVT